MNKDRLISVFLVMWVTLAPIRPAMAAMFLLPLFDLTLGLICAVRAKRPITSAGLKRTVGKILLYELATILAFVAENWLTGPTLPAIRMVTGLVGVTELKSCLEHLDELGGQPLFATLLSKLAPANPTDKTTPPPPTPGV